MNEELVTEIRVDMGVTINIGNYQSIKVQLGETVSIPDGKSLEQTSFIQSLEHVKKELVRQAKAAYEQKKIVQEEDMGE